MKLTICPHAGLPGERETTASVSGDILTIDGVSYDLSAVPEGGEATPEGDHPFIGKITRVNGEVVATIRWRHGEDADGRQPLDPAHWVVTVADGPVPSPVVKTPAHEEQPA
jgi:hypothetical protein